MCRKSCDCNGLRILTFLYISFLGAHFHNFVRQMCAKNSTKYCKKSRGNSRLCVFIENIMRLSNEGLAVLFLMRFFNTAFHHVLLLLISYRGADRSTFRLECFILFAEICIFQTLFQVLSEITHAKTSVRNQPSRLFLSVNSTP